MDVGGTAPISAESAPDATAGRPMSDPSPQVRVVIVMGVAGAGKTLVGSALARELGWAFYDADDFHSPENVAKMHAGIGLTDADRAPWLAKLRDLIDHVIRDGRRAVLACSALKHSYRQALTPEDAPPGTVRFVFLDVPAEVLRERLEHRAHHYAPPELLASQLATLEPTRDAIRVDGTLPPDEIVRAVRSALGV
jgi:gluconokinase